MISDRSNRKRCHHGMRRDETINDVKIEETFSMYGPNQEHDQQSPAGEGCYISASYKSKRFYGVLIEESALKDGTVNYFQDQSDSLSVNDRMRLLMNHNKLEEGERPDDQKINADGNNNNNIIDACLEETNGGNKKNHNGSHDVQLSKDRTIQKFKYIPADQGMDGYRILLATYANALAASEDDYEKARQILDACECGGNFVGDYYYYQYEAEYRTLRSDYNTTDEMAKSSDQSDYLSTSISFDTFLRTGASIPRWHPLRHNSMSQSKILRMMNMKMDTRGILKLGDKKINGNVPAVTSNAPRFAFKVGIVGGGIAGLACAEELLRLAQKHNLSLEVVILEARDRLGGRIFTDYDTFKDQDGKTIPVDLGAAWIHGEEKNPLAEKARQFNMSLIATSEQVKMLDGPMAVVGHELDIKTEKLFNQLLDDATEFVWSQGNEDINNRRQDANRWYASIHHNDEGSTKCLRSDVPEHRFSSDISMDLAIRHVQNDHSNSMLTDKERRLLTWHIKNVEYAFGANLGDLSMKYWDIDDDQSFEGDHVMLKEGFSTVLEHFVNDLMARYGEQFKVTLNCPIGKIDYGFNGRSYSYLQSGRTKDSMIDISDSCAVTNKSSGDTMYFDFVVSTLPLGVLKRSIDSSNYTSDCNYVEFSPPLSQAKFEAIRSLGFGLLNKVLLQFPSPAFWRAPFDRDENNTAFLSKTEYIFGNASVFHPNYYMFYDLGRCFQRNDDDPAVLMTLISGTEAATIEKLPDHEVVGQVLTALRGIFSEIIVPDPITYKVTKWGLDEYSRGCYSFLAPGSTPEDFDIVRNPCCTNGDSFICDDNEVMRLYWAGEHTSKEYPSLAHGAYISGLKAAQEIFQNIYKGPRLGNKAQKHDHEIPLSLYRSLYPRTPVICILCEKSDVNESSGYLIAFCHNQQYYLVHTKCAEYSPEVEYRKGQWRHVIRAIKRGRQLKCHRCNHYGATVGCGVAVCKRVYHIPCCTQWNFSLGKEFFCAEHNASVSTGPVISDQQLPSEKPVSLQYFQNKNPGSRLVCALCSNKNAGDACQLGHFVIFERKKDAEPEFIVYHKNCLLFSDVTGTQSTSEEKTPSVFDVFHRSKRCSHCNDDGASIRCSANCCFRYYHFPCCHEIGWLDLTGKSFLCPTHVPISLDEDDTLSLNTERTSGTNHGIQHNLLCLQTDPSV